MPAELLYGAHIRANGIRQHYLRFGGQGMPLVLVPGITSPAITWGFIAEQMARHYDVYVLDVRGRGLSEAEPGADYSLDVCAADLNAFTRTLGLKDYYLVGHSMGARIAIRATRHQPAGVKKMVWVDPPVSGPGRREYPARLPWYVDSIRLAKAGADWEQMKAFLPSWTEGQLRLRAEWLHTCLEEAVVASYNGFHEDDIHQDIPHIRIPTLLMTAERGDVVREEDVAELRTLMPALATCRIGNAGHMIPWDNLQGFLDGLREFLR